MRIIAGEFRGRKLLPPQTGATRPITDRVKQSVFDILAPLIPGAAVYDCFAGTGSLGLECLSRGAAHVTFLERDRSAVARLSANIRTLGLEPKSTLVATDLFEYLHRPHGGSRADLVFLDPPYRFLTEHSGELRTLAADLAAYHLASHAQVVFRHDVKDVLELTPLAQIDVRRYGSMGVDFLEMRGAGAGAKTL